jgi:hypothetical protein
MLYKLTVALNQGIEQPSWQQIASPYQHQASGYQ